MLVRKRGLQVGVLALSLPDCRWQAGGPNLGRISAVYLWLHALKDTPRITYSQYRA